MVVSLSSVEPKYNGTVDLFFLGTITVMDAPQQWSRNKTMVGWLVVYGAVVEFVLLLFFLGTAPKINEAPEKWCLEDDPFLLGFGNFSGANC